MQYYAKRVLRLTATPHSIALGVAAGVFMSFTPFLGIHIMMAVALAWLIGGNVVAAAIGTVVGNPITFPFMWGASLELGRLILEGPRDVALAPVHLGRVLMHLEFSQLWGPVLKPLTIGCIPIGLVFALLFYALTRWATIGFREDRRRRLAERAKRRAEAQNYGARPAAG